MQIHTNGNQRCNTHRKLSPILHWQQQKSNPLFWRIFTTNHKLFHSENQIWSKNIQKEKNIQVPWFLPSTTTGISSQQPKIMGPLCSLTASVHSPK
jgi:hypothetical protein